MKEDLTAQIKIGDQQAYEAVFKSWYEPLCAYACSLLHNMDDAEEVTQKMFCTLWDKRAMLDVQTSLKAYLYKAVHNACLNHIKHRKVRNMYQTEFLHSHEESDNRSSNLLIYSELELALQRAVEQLPAQCRAAFVLSREEQLSYPEIAERLHISRNTVENHISKALRLLRQALKEFLMAAIVMFV
ncbi:DNA-directed RNA polymerase sigma-70 factor [Bacteroidia bacterium]|nr:DNA-directed RNA polymerase sigma-70 factor [Bacteroidia bacterium]